MNEEEKQIVKKFCDYCNWAYMTLQMRKYLWDENDKQSLLKAPHHEYFFGLILEVLQQQWMLDTAKLMDKDRIHGHDLLTISFMLKHFHWSNLVKDKLEKLKLEMDACFPQLIEARNNFGAHNNKESILLGKTLGSFDAGKEVSFFNALESFASEMHQVAFDCPFEFDKSVPADCSNFMKTYEAGLEARFGKIQGVR